ncbi:hypothetical protein O0I10_009207 [Lichtheimia ornata]|uniref:F-box domain-containing protein n=1 Tax=Lichtheimia ornata TaxID=688661 RepID=A0AAD7UYS5_9FUNG|nr:uncharacterized protein O0I10_009207 [Lichtheimia ornata]KAJ8655172.1 hypothetical protein O0I10_009207 [Lichtheimia ornata]
MLNQLPNEILHEIFVRLLSPKDYFHLSTTCRNMYLVGSSRHCQIQFLLSYFGDDDSLQPWLSVCCEMIAASNIKPIDRNLLATASNIDSQIFCDYFAQQSDKAIQRTLLDLFRYGSEDGYWKVPSFACDQDAMLLCAKSQVRHITQTGVRRVFHDVTLVEEDDSLQHYYCVFHLIDTFVTFKEEEHGYIMRQGHVIYKDEEDIRDTTAWSKLFKSVRIAKQQNGMYPTQGPPKLQHRYHASSLAPNHWQPCILRNYMQCRLTMTMNKTSLAAGDYVDHIEMSEHRESDMIRLAFYDANTNIRGYLLLSEDGVLWWD